MNETEKTAYYAGYNKQVHLIGRFGLSLAIVLLFGAPLGFGLVLGASPDWGAFAKGFIQVAIIYWTSGVLEFLVYAPMLGSGASYLAFITGNLINLKIPCAVNARDICGTTVGTPENDIVSTLSVATSSLVNILVLAIGVMCLIPLKPILENPALQPAFDNVIPALFGALAFKYFSQSLKVTVVPLLLMCVIFVLVPSLISSVSFLILVAGALAIGIAYVLYQKNML
ncbi:MAG: hypothetical protein RSD61_05385 [Ruthenibacterium sp.]